MSLSMIETYLLHQKDKPSNASVNGRLTSYTRRINQVMPLSMIETYLLHQNDKPSNASVNGRDLPLTPEG